jgi:DNA-directed RNA polymerase specialized sigma24 family protein
MGRYWFSYPVEELAAAVKLAPKTVYKRLSKTRERLRAYLAERGYRV